MAPLAPGAARALLVCSGLALRGHAIFTSPQEAGEGQPRPQRDPAHEDGPQSHASIGTGGVATAPEGGLRSEEHAPGEREGGPQSHVSIGTGGVATAQPAVLAGEAAPPEGGQEEPPASEPAQHEPPKHHKVHGGVPQTHDADIPEDIKALMREHVRHEFAGCQPNRKTQGDTDIATCAIDVPFFTITRSASRRHKLLQQFKEICPPRQGERAKRNPIEFVDGLDPDDTSSVLAITNFTEASWLEGPSRRSGATRSEMAVTVSHLKAIWAAFTRLASSKQLPRAALVVEDDVDLSPALFWRPESIRRWVQEADLPEDWLSVQLYKGCELPNRRGMKRAHFGRYAGRNVMRKPPYPIYGAAAILYSERGLRTILEAAGARVPSRRPRSRRGRAHAPEFAIGDFKKDYIADVFLYEATKESSWTASPPLFLHPVDGLDGSATLQRRLPIDDEVTDLLFAMRTQAATQMWQSWCNNSQPAPPPELVQWIDRKC